MPNKTITINRLTMLEEFKRRCCDAIRHNITLPSKRWCYINDMFLQFTYCTNGETKYMSLTRQEAATFLVRHGNIYSYSLVKGSVKLYIKTFTTSTKKNHAPVQKIVIAEVKWNELHQYISHSDVLKFAAEHEFEIKGAITGHCMGKLVKFSGNFFKAA